MLSGGTLFIYDPGLPRPTPPPPHTSEKVQSPNHRPRTSTRAISDGDGVGLQVGDVVLVSVAVFDVANM